MTTATDEPNTNGEPIEPEVMPKDTSVVKAPGVPTTVDELAALQEEGEEIIQARVQILQTLRMASIRATSPQDWLLFKASDGSGPDRITAYLQDQGCQRVRPLWGIDVTPNGDFLKIEVGEEFAYSIKGDAHCSLTKRTITDVEGLRYSTDDFCKNLTPIMKEMRVRQAARANLDGNATRNLTGLKNVPVEEIVAAWAGTNKTIALCPKGRGYGSQAERSGARPQEASHVQPGQEPPCELCGGKMKFIPAGTTKTGKPYGAFWSCPNGGEGKKHEKATISDSAWRDRLAAQKQNGEREPGAEG